MERTTTPKGVGPKLHVRKTDEGFEIWCWGPWGSKAMFISSYQTEEEAGDDIFRRTYEYDFLPDDQRDTRHWLTRQEAESALLENQEGRG